MSERLVKCPDCDSPAFDRRDFLKTSAAVGIAATTFGALPAFGAEPKPVPTSETLAAQLYKDLTEEQKKLCAFTFDDPLRQRVDNNWRITKALINTFNADQQDLIRQIFLGLHSEQYAEPVLKQVEHDNAGAGGLGGCAVAFFGEPGTGKFEFVLSGRHVTRRCDGDSVEGAAFGGPIFYGHAAQGFNEPPDHPGNAYWYQALRANELFQALDGNQRRQALLDNSRNERGNDTVKLTGKKSGLPGIPISELSADQKKLAQEVMSDVLAPFREADREECMKLINANDFDALHFSFYKNQDVGGDSVWDVWQIEGPTTIWYFRGDPHVHTWVNIQASA